MADGSANTDSMTSEMRTIMISFYLLRLKNKAPEERQDYLDNTVAERYREQVKEQWNEQHPDETLK